MADGISDPLFCSLPIALRQGLFQIRAVLFLARPEEPACPSDAPVILLPPTLLRAGVADVHQTPGLLHGCCDQNSVLVTEQEAPLASEPASSLASCQFFI